MRIFYFILIFFTVFFNKVQAVNEFDCVIRISKNDCSTCFNNLFYIRSINPLYNIKILMENTDPDDSSESFKPILKLKNKYIFQFSDSLYYSLSDAVYSTVHLFFKGKLLLSIPLTDLPLRLYDINRFRIIDTLTFNSKLRSSYDEMKMTNNTIYLFREKFSDITLVKWENLKIYKIYKMDNRFNEIAYRLKFPNEPDKYREVKKYYDSIGNNFSISQITSFTIKNDTLFFLSKNIFTVDTILNWDDLPQKSKGKKTRWTFSFFTLFEIVNDSLIEALPVSDIKNEQDDYKDSYNLWGGKLNEENNILYISIGRITKFKDDDFFIGKWKKDKDRWQFIEPVKMSLSKFHKANHLGYNFTEYLVHWPNIMFNITPELYDTKKDIRSFLKLNIGNSNFSDIEHFNVKIDFYIIDFIVLSDVIKIVYFRGNDYYIGYIEKNNLVKEEYLFSVTKQLKFPLMFEDEHTIAYLPENLKCLVRKKVK